MVVLENVLEAGSGFRLIMNCCLLVFGSCFSAGECWGGERELVAFERA